jgi:hypothetical protein
LFAAVLLALAAAAGGTVLVVSPASADGAVVIDDAGCGLLDGDGGFAVADSDHAVVTPSGNGVLKCKAEVTPPSSGQAAHFDFGSTGLLCGTPAGVTDDWKETVSASGEATLTCKVHA